MSGALMNKVWDLFGMDSAEPEGYEEENVYDYDDEEEEVEDKKLFGRKNNNKVVNMPQTQTNAIKMVISQPTTFEQSDEICAFLKEKKSVIVNLEYVNKDVARRIVDFISGGVYALAYMYILNHLGIENPPWLNGSVQPWGILMDVPLAVPTILCYHKTRK